MDVLHCRLTAELAAGSWRRCRNRKSRTRPRRRCMARARCWRSCLVRRPPPPRCSPRAGSLVGARPQMAGRPARPPSRRWAAACFARTARRGAFQGVPQGLEVLQGRGPPCMWGRQAAASVAVGMAGPSIACCCTRCASTVMRASSHLAGGCGLPRLVFHRWGSNLGSPSMKQYAHAGYAGQFQSRQQHLAAVFRALCFGMPAIVAVSSSVLFLFSSLRHSTHH